MRPNLNLMKATLTGALGGLLFGFDTVVISGIIDAVVRLYHLSDYGKGWTVAIALIGTVVGSFSAGVVGHKLGSRETLRLTAVLYVLSAIGSALAWNWPALMVFRFIGGLGIGASSVLGPVYIAELAPAKWRGRLVGAFQFNVVFGILVAYTSNYLIRLLHLGATEWRWQVGVAAFPAAIFLALLFGIPRSPRWSASRDRIDEALEVLKLMGEQNPEAELADIRAALAEEHATAREPVFRWKYRYPLFLAITIGAFNQLAGINAILYYLNDIFAAAGFSQLSGDQQAIAIGLTNLIFHYRRHERDRQDRPQDAAAHRSRGDSELSRRSRMDLLDQFASRNAGLAPDCLHRVLRALAGRRHLGVHRRSFSQSCSLKRARRWQCKSLDNEYDHRACISRVGCEHRTRRAVHLFRGDDGGPVRGGALHVSRNKGADAGTIATQACAGRLAQGSTHQVDRTAHVVPRLQSAVSGYASVDL